MSIGPSSARHAAMKSAREAASRMSPRIATARPPSASIAATVSRSVPGTPSGAWSRLRATAATRAPSDARRLAIAAPIPRLAPVTSATFPSQEPPMRSPSGLAEAALHVALPDLDLPAPLLRGDAARARRQVLADLVEAHPGGADRRPLRLRGLLEVGPARRHVALGMPRGIEPVGHARVAVRDHVADGAVGVALGLETVQARDAVRVVERLAPEVREVEADVHRRHGDVVLDHERLVGREVEDAASVDVRAHAAARGARGGVRLVEGVARHEALAVAVHVAVGLEQHRVELVREVPRPARDLADAPQAPRRRLRVEGGRVLLLGADARDPEVDRVLAVPVVEELAPRDVGADVGATLP